MIDECDARLAELVEYNGRILNENAACIARTHYRTENIAAADRRKVMVLYNSAEVSGHYCVAATLDDKHYDVLFIYAHDTVFVREGSAGSWLPLTISSLCAYEDGSLDALVDGALQEFRALQPPIPAPRVELLQCRDCGTTFPFGDGERRWFARMGFSRPSRCPSCRAKRTLGRSNEGALGEAVAAPPETTKQALHGSAEDNDERRSGRI
jgi:hypothetical protein